MSVTPAEDPAARYFTAITAALSGLEIFMRDDRSPLYRHGIVARIVAEYIARLEKSFACWENRLGFIDTFRISRAESGFPVFQNLLELENDRRQADQRLANIPLPDELRDEMADFILRHKEFPAALQKSMAELISFSALLLLFALNFHQEVIRALVTSYQVAPLNIFFNPQAALVDVADTLSESVFLVLRLGSPFVAYALLVNLTVGFVNKLVPQIPVYFISQPLIISGGIVLFYLAIATLLSLFADGFVDLTLAR
jgi:hypothetical protein